MELHLRATGCCLPYGITQCFVTCHPTQVNTLRLNHIQRPVLDLPTPKGWKAELTLVNGYNALAKEIPRCR